MTYDHTQHAPLHLLMHGVALGLLPLAWAVSHQPLAVAAVLAVAVVTLLLAWCFRWLRVSGGSTSVTLQYGPLPLFRHRIDYADITAVEVGRSSLIDGWGIHWVPGRGWTYNLWGFDCAVLHLGERIVRIGTDDPQGLARFLEEQIALHGHGS